MNKFLFQTPNKDIYTFVAGTGWQIIGNGEPSDLMFIKNGVTSIANVDFLALLSLTLNVDIDILASKQSDPVNVETAFIEDVDIGSEMFCKKVTLDLSQYAVVNSVAIKEV